MLAQVIQAVAQTVSDGGPSTMTIIAALVALVVGSSGGGIFGSYVMFKRLRIEKQQSETQVKVDLAGIPVEQFKAMFPGGLGDAVEHWRDEAKALYVEVDELREQRKTDHEEILNLRSDLKITNRKLEHTKRELDRAEARIAELEKGHSDPHE